jgi:hypothetical protein
MYHKNSESSAHNEDALALYDDEWCLPGRVGPINWVGGLCINSKYKEALSTAVGKGG